MPPKLISHVPTGPMGSPNRFKTSSKGRVKSLIISSYQYLNFAFVQPKVATVISTFFSIGLVALPGLFSTLTLNGRKPIRRLVGTNYMYVCVLRLA